MKMWARARIHLGLSERDFWKLTPRQLQALYRAQEDLLAHTEFCTGVLAAAVANFSMAGAKEPLQAADFFGSPWALKLRQTGQEKSKERVNAIVRNRMEQMYLESQKNGHNGPVFRVDRPPGMAPEPTDQDR